MARLRFHHLVLETRSTLPADPAAHLLASLPAAAREAPADLLLESRPAAAAEELSPRFAGPPAFVHGDLALRVDRGAVEIAWPRARYTVDAGPVPRARGVVDAALLGEPGGLHLAAQLPALFAFAAAVRARGVYHLHAACLVLPGDRTVLVPALAGSGKSTLAAALAAVGAGYLGDDTVWLADLPEGPRLLALPREFHLAERSARAAGVEAKLAEGPHTLAGKRRLDPAVAFPGQFRWEAPPPAAILLPRITGAPRTRLEPAGPADALGLLLESSALVATRGLPGGAAHLPLLGALADDAAVFRAELGLDLLADGVAVARELVARLADA